MTPKKAAIAEAEVKFQFTEAEYLPLLQEIIQRGFKQSAAEILTDYYLDFAKSTFGGYDFTRLRCPDAGNDLLTSKHWVADNHGNPVRMEEENIITSELALQLLDDNPNALKLIKKRSSFQGIIPPHHASLVIDDLTLGDEEYHFLECEVLTTREAAEKTRQLLFSWATANLPISAQKESPSMLEWLLQSIDKDASRKKPFS